MIALQRLARPLLGIASATLLLVALHRDMARRDLRRSLEHWTRSSGLATRQPDLVRRAVHDPDLWQARFLVAQALVGEAADPAWLSHLDRRSAARQVPAVWKRLDTVRRLASAGLEDRPASWHAAMLLGLTTYLPWLRAADPRLFTQRSDWEEPLDHSAALAPGQDEPDQARCSAYLPLWSSLSTTERRSRLSLLARCFTDPQTLRRSLGAWLEASGDLELALSVMPERADAWKQLEAWFVNHRDWDHVASSYDHWQSLLLRELTADQTTAEARLAGGDPRAAASAMRSVVARALPTAPFFTLVRRALSRCPAGSPSTSASAALHPMLYAYLDLCLRGRCPLDAAAMERLSLWAEPLDPVTEAMAQAMAGHSKQVALLVERKEAPLSTEEWGPYVLLTARLAADRGDTAAQRKALSLLAPELVDSPLARTVADLPNPLTAGSESWPAQAWRWHNEVPQLDLIANRGASGLSVALDAVPPGGAAVAATFDGRPALTTAARSGEKLEIPTPVTPGLHLLQVTTLAGGLVRPGDVRLLGNNGS